MYLTNTNHITSQVTMANAKSKAAPKASQAEKTALLWKCATHSVVVSLPVVLLLKLLGFELSKTAATGMVLLFTALSVRSEAAKKNGGKSEAVFGTPVKQPFEKKVKSYASAVKTDLAKTDMAEPNVAEPAMADPNMTKADNGFAGSATPAKFPKLTKEQKRELSEKARIAVGASPIREQDLAL